MTKYLKVVISLVIYHIIYVKFPKKKWFCYDLLLIGISLGQHIVVHHLKCIQMRKSLFNAQTEMCNIIPLLFFQTELPELPNAMSERLRTFIEWLQDKRSWHAPLLVIRSVTYFTAIPKDPVPWPLYSCTVAELTLIK